MRTYAPNSPRAAARIMALVLLSDGHLSQQELDVLQQIDAAGQLGLPYSELQEVIRDFCNDLTCAVHQNWSHACQVDGATLGALAADLSDAQLRRRVLRLCMVAIDADGYFAHGEAHALRTLAQHWGLQH